MECISVSGVDGKTLPFFAAPLKVFLDPLPSPTALPIDLAKTPTLFISEADTVGEDKERGRIRRKGGGVNKVNVQRKYTRWQRDGPLSEVLPAPTPLLTSRPSTMNKTSSYVTSQSSYLFLKQHTTYLFL